MFDIESRKKALELVAGAISKLPGSDRLKGDILYFGHNWLVCSAGAYVFAGPINTLFYMSYALILSLLPLHLLFNGCLCVRLERHFWGYGDWKGMWTMPFTILRNLGFPLSKGLENSFFVTAGLGVILMGVFRLAWSQLGN